jgi:hypothetical protein
MVRVTLALSLTLAVVPTALRAQAFSERGFIEGHGVFFPQEAPNDPTRPLGDATLQQEVFIKPASWFQLAGGVDVRTDSHHQIDERWRLDVWDEGVLRPRLSLRRAAATFNHGPLTLDIGKQFIRWGKTDIVVPTDRFAPRDFLNVIDTEFLAVTGARAVLQFGPESVDVVYVPRFTPSRLPLLDQRWAVVPPELATIPIVDTTGPLPKRAQAGVRWAHVGGGFELSLSMFDGFNHLPELQVLGPSAAQASGTPGGVHAEFSRVYPSIRSYGADMVVPTGWLTFKGEASYFTSPSVLSDEYVLYVVQLERQTGEWVFAGGYVDQAVTRGGGLPTFSPDRQLAQSIIGRAAYTIGPSSHFVFETAVRKHGAYGKAEYSQALGSHWRTTLTGVLLEGEAGDFLGQYRRNSHAALTLRLSY